MTEHRRAQNRAAWKKWYQKNKTAFNTASYLRQKDRRHLYQQRIAEIKTSTGCSRCPQRHPACLDFHHKDPNTKLIDIGNAIRSGWGWKRILEEINKCFILCANCHRIEHYTGD